MKYNAIALLVGLLVVSAVSTSANAANVTRLRDCRFAGQSLPAVDLSTTNASNWTVTGPAQPSGVPAVGGPIPATLSAWSGMSGYWVQPFPTGTTNQYGTAWKNAAGGNYTYKIQFYLPCDPRNYASLSIGGAIAADNSFIAYLNGNNQIASCGGNNCFQNPTLFPAVASGFVAGLNTITVVVANGAGSYTGLAVKASLTAKCGKECCTQLRERGRGDMQDELEATEKEQ